MPKFLRFGQHKNTLPKAVIIKGNPDKMTGMEKLAEAYYQDIAYYLKALGFSVEFDPGEPMTCPDLNAALWVAHSRGVDRVRCIPKTEQWRFLKFGATDGIIHPKDARWQRTITNHVTTKQLPPKEHFEFTMEQQRAIDQLVRQLT